MRNAAVAGAFVLLSAVVPAQDRTPDEQLLDRAAAYVQQFVDAYSNVVAEEIYVQRTTSPQRRRTLRSDYLLVRFPGAQEWHAFRDVLEVDGKPVGDDMRSERLMQLFVEPPENARRRIDEIARAGSQYNLVNIGSLNEPLRVLAFLQPGYRERFRFTFAGIDRDVGPAARTVRFEEVRRPTVLRQGSSVGDDLPSYGLVWIDEPTGRVLKTELRPGRFASPRIMITTTFRFDARFGIAVPAEMRDMYPDRAGEMNGVATYGNFRRFQAQTEETIDAPPNPR